MVNLATINLNAVPYPPPEKKKNITDLELVAGITFMWSPVGPDCPAIHYKILASNCGSCPLPPTTPINVTCTDIPTDDSTCVFVVSTVVCGNNTGNVSMSIRPALHGYM